MTTLTKSKILDSLKDKETRELFAEEHVSTGIPFQIHGLREKLGLTQAELARRAGMAQERISVLEDPNYEFLPKIPTLIKLANVFDVPLIVKFGSWLELFDWETNLSPERLAPNSFDEEIDNLERAAEQGTATDFVTVWEDTTIRFAVPSSNPMHAMAMAASAAVRVIAQDTERPLDFLPANSTSAEMISTRIH